MWPFSGNRTPRRLVVAPRTTGPPSAPPGGRGFGAALVRCLCVAIPSSTGVLRRGGGSMVRRPVRSWIIGIGVVAALLVAVPVLPHAARVVDAGAAAVGAFLASLFGFLLRALGLVLLVAFLGGLARGLWRDG